MPTASKALLCALAAILIWASLATLGTLVRAVPPFLLVGLSLGIAGLLCTPFWREWRVPPRTVLVGVAGIFGYHFLLFSAFRSAPAVQANTLNYLWPLVIVLGTPLVFPKLRLGPRHLAGALLGFAGAALVVSQGRLSLSAQYATGYVLAVLAALTWGGYSLLTKRLPPFPTRAVGLFCLLSGLSSLACHFLLEPRYQLTIEQGWVIAGLGLGPMGGAFFLWDWAMKHGDPRSIGALAFATPLLSTALLVMTGQGQLSLWSLAALACILSGALLAGRN